MVFFFLLLLLLLLLLFDSFGFCCCVIHICCFVLYICCWYCTKSRCFHASECVEMCSQCRASAIASCANIVKSIYKQKKTVNIIHFASFHTCIDIHYIFSHFTCQKLAIRCTILPHFVSISMECNNIVQFSTVCMLAAFFACVCVCLYAFSTLLLLHLVEFFLSLSLSAL